MACLAPDTDAERPFITKGALAALFLGYYWNLEITYHLREGTDPDRDPVVMVLVRELAKTGTIRPGEKLKDFKSRLQGEYSKLVGTVAREAFDDVIPRFHIVRGKPFSPNVFAYSGAIGRVGNEIKLTKGGRQFLIQCRKLVDYVAVAGWVSQRAMMSSAATDQGSR